MGRRRYTSAGQILVWCIEGPRRPWWLVYAMAGVGMLLMLGQVFRWIPFHVGTSTIGGMLCALSSLWWYTRTAQLRYYKDVVARWHSGACAKCGYPTRGLDSRICPECGTARACPRCGYSLAGATSDGAQGDPQTAAACRRHQRQGKEQHARDRGPGPGLSHTTPPRSDGGGSVTIPGAGARSFGAKRLQRMNVLSSL